MKKLKKQKQEWKEKRCAGFEVAMDQSRLEKQINHFE